VKAEEKMKRLCGGWLALALSSAPALAQASDWWFIADVGEAAAEYIVYVDKSSIERVSRSSAMTAWMLTVYHDDQVSEGAAYRSEKLRLRIDCGKELAGVENRARYSAYKETVSQSRKAEPELTAIPPQSPLQTAVGFICSGGRQPARTIPVYDPNKDAEQRFWLKDKEHRIKPPQ